MAVLWLLGLLFLLWWWLLPWCIIHRIIHCHYFPCSVHL
jgi:hypothetical protein